MNPNVLAIHIDRLPNQFIINVAVKTSEKTFQSFYGRQDSISEYGVNTIIETGRPHTKAVARNMFPMIADQYTFDEAPTEYQVKLNEKIGALSDKYERAKDCLNFITITRPEEQKLVIETHDIIRSMRDELAESYKG